MKKPFFRRLVAALSALALVMPAMPATAGGIIRDAEIENSILAWSTPIFIAAGLNQKAVSLYIVNDKELNAFVSGGQNIFITTGLLMRSENYAQVDGVIAHETGHIAGGHLARMEDAIRAAQAESIIAMILGAGVIAAGGGRGQSGQAGGAVMAGGQDVATRNFLKYTRGQEAAADQAALSYLDQTQQSSRGLDQFLGILAKNEEIYSGRVDPYMLSHPLTKDRLDNVRHHLEVSPFSGAPSNPLFEEEHARMRAKLVGFLQTFKQTLRIYPEKDTSLEARYARAIAYYLKPDLPKALALINGLIKEHPNDPFFYELKGQMLFENGHTAEAIGPYQKSVDIFPQSALLRIALAQAELAQNTPAFNKAAIANLVKAVKQEKQTATGWQSLGIAYGKEGHIGLASLSLAEKFLIVGNKTDARQQAERAEKNLPKGSPSWVRAQDILLAAKN